MLSGPDQPVHLGHAPGDCYPDPTNPFISGMRRGTGWRDRDARIRCGVRIAPPGLMFERNRRIPRGAPVGAASHRAAARPRIGNAIPKSVARCAILFRFVESSITDSIGRTATGRPPQRSATRLRASRTFTSRRRSVSSADVISLFTSTTRPRRLARCHARTSMRSAIAEVVERHLERRLPPQALQLDCLHGDRRSVALVEKTVDLATAPCDAQRKARVKASEQPPERGDRQVLAMAALDLATRSTARRRPPARPRAGFDPGAGATPEQPARTVDRPCRAGWQPLLIAGSSGSAPPGRGRRRRRAAPSRSTDRPRGAARRHGRCRNRPARRAAGSARGPGLDHRDRPRHAASQRNATGTRRRGVTSRCRGSRPAGGAPRPACIDARVAMATPAERIRTPVAGARVLARSAALAAWIALGAVDGGLRRLGRWQPAPGRDRAGSRRGELAGARCGIADVAGCADERPRGAGPDRGPRLRAARRLAFGPAGRPPSPGDRRPRRRRPSLRPPPGWRRHSPGRASSTSPATVRPRT